MHNFTGLVDGPDLVSVALLLGIDTLPHGGLADDVQSTVGHLQEVVFIIFISIIHMVIE